MNRFSIYKSGLGRWGKLVPGRGKFTCRERVLKEIAYWPAISVTKGPFAYGRMLGVRQYCWEEAALFREKNSIIPLER